MELKKPDKGVLKRFMQEFFPFNEFVKIGFFTKEMKGDWQAQADRVCHYYGFKTVYEYGAREIICHISQVEPKDGEPFITVIPSIYS